MAILIKLLSLFRTIFIMVFFVLNLEINNFFEIGVSSYFYNTSLMYC